MFKVRFGTLADVRISLVLATACSRSALRNSRKAKRVWFCPWYALDLITLYTALSDRDRTLEQLLYAIEHDNRAGF